MCSSVREGKACQSIHKRNHWYRYLYTRRKRDEGEQFFGKKSLYLVPWWRWARGESVRFMLVKQQCRQYCICKRSLRLTWFGQVVESNVWNWGMGPVAGVHSVPGKTGILLSAWQGSKEPLQLFQLWSQKKKHGDISFFLFCIGPMQRRLTTHTQEEAVLSSSIKKSKAAWKNWKNAHNM